MGEGLQWWHFKEAAYPLRDPAYIFSLNPVITILTFRFTYRRFWLFLAVDAASNLVSSYLFLDHFWGIRDVLQYLKLGPFHVFIITTLMGALLYWYQLWQEGIFIKHEKNNASVNLQPAMAKPLDNDDQDKTD